MKKEDRSKNDILEILAVLPHLSNSIFELRLIFSEETSEEQIKERKEYTLSQIEKLNNKLIALSKALEI